MGTLWGKIGKKIDIFFNFEKKNFVSEIPRELRLVWYDNKISLILIIDNEGNIVVAVYYYYYIFVRRGRGGGG